MGFLNKFLWSVQTEDTRRAKAREVSQEIVGQIHLNPLCSDYENLFAQVRPFINEMILVRPFGVGRNGAPLPLRKTPELAILNDPNEQMSWADFADLMFATWLTEDELNIHVHHKNGRVYGYSIIPQGSKYWIGGDPFWQVVNSDGEIVTIGKDEVMTLYFSRSTRNPYKGVSPATASRIAAQLDDLAMQYEKAYFENGAIPATLTFITASTREGYEQKRHELENGLKGARNRNKTVFLWRQYNAELNATMDEVEVKTIQAPNNTLAIKDIVDIINDKLNKSVGVSNFIMGDDSSAKYDNAELSDHQFIKRRIYPALTSFWAQFQHELDRITGGIGYSIQFEIVVPELTARAATKSETAKRNAETLIELMDAGATPQAAIDALELDDNWQKVASNIFANRLAERTSDDKKKINDAHEHCEHCEDAFKPFTKEERAAKSIFERLMSLARAIAFEDKEADADKIELEMASILRDEALLGHKNALEALETLIQDDDIRAEIQRLLDEGYEISGELETRIENRTNNIVEDFASQVRELVRSVLMNSEFLSANEIKQRLQAVLPSGRAATIARNETIYAFRAGRIEQSQELAKKYDLKIGVRWMAVHDENTCNTCAAMDGQTTMLGEPFQNSVRLPKGSKLINGKIVGRAPAGATKEERKKYTGTDTFGWVQDMWNDDGIITHCHVNCRCTFSEFVILDEEQ